MKNVKITVRIRVDDVKGYPSRAIAAAENAMEGPLTMDEAMSEVKNRVDAVMADVRHQMALAQAAEAAAEAVAPKKDAV